MLRKSKQQKLFSVLSPLVQIKKTLPPKKTLMGKSSVVLRSDVPIYRNLLKFNSLVRKRDNNKK